MHYRFLVTFNKEAAETSEEARDYVTNHLHDNGFCGEGRWSGGLADWFVIGGRWSGELSRHSWGKLLYQQMDAIQNKEDVHVWGVHYRDKEKQWKQKELETLLDEMWKVAAPEAYKHIAVNRGIYDHDGYEDDAMILTQELYDALLKAYEGQEDSEHHADLDDEPVSPDMVGRKWLVVVDYHN